MGNDHDAVVLDVALHLPKIHTCVCKYTPVCVNTHLCVNTPLCRYTPVCSEAALYVFVSFASRILKRSALVSALNLKLLVG